MVHSQKLDQCCLLVFTLGHSVNMSFSRVVGGIFLNVIAVVHFYT